MGNGRIRLLPSAKPIARLIDDRAVFQEAQLSPRDRAMRRVSWNLANCHASAETTCTTSPEQIEVMKLEGYSGTMCNKRRGWPRSNFAEIFGIRELDSLGYRVVSFLWSYV